ncbi:hypothetical protein L6164_002256 [Bauhinia variegata]|uniref:Uncharacterized protein n=1 Tax=Bauhinia variegata TaxID=167791 RepID=A0ACB9PZS1_BAUVA|nr:hypothetical protein L6164_002256 [Bauhinia variegata]
MLSTIRAVLEDAEEKQLSDRAIRDWLHKLKDAALLLDNFLDEISTEALRLEYQGRKHGPLSKSLSSSLSSLYPKNLLFRCKIAKKMKDIRETLDEIAQERIKFHLSEVVIERNAQVMELRETTSIITQSQVYGRDEDKKKIVDFLIDIVRDDFGNIVQFKMHDLVHDLAQWIMAEVCCISDDGDWWDQSRIIHHLSFWNVDISSKISAISLEQLQSSRTYIRFGFINHVIAVQPIDKLHSSRALYFRGSEEVPSSVSLLKHLRYLNLSQGYFKTLPESICSLRNLQILNLDACKWLKELPENITSLKALRHLYMRGCESLSSTPPKMGQLTCLITLNVYVASNKRGSLLAELKHLKLKGEIHIKHLERVTCVMDAKEANLAAKQLDGMLVSWDRDGASELQENVEQILEALEPHPQLKYLWIKDYKGQYFSTWMSNPTLKHLCYIQLIHCKNCLQLPALGKLPSLKELRIHKMIHVRFIDDESYDDGGRTARGFKSLQHLTITQLPNLEGLSKVEGEDMFPFLSKMEIGQCPKLVLPHLPSVTELLIDEDPFITSCIVTFVPRRPHLSTKRLFLCSINKLHGLQRLCLYNDTELTSFPSGMLQGLSFLKELHICKYTKLEALPSDLVHLHALQELQIYECSSLVYFPEQVLQGLHSLQTLKLLFCRELKRLQEDFSTSLLSSI